MCHDRLLCLRRRITQQVAMQPLADLIIPQIYITKSMQQVTDGFAHVDKAPMLEVKTRWHHHGQEGGGLGGRGLTLLHRGPPEDGATWQNAARIGHCSAAGAPVGTREEARPWGSGGHVEPADKAVTSWRLNLVAGVNMEHRPWQQQYS